MLMAIKAAVVLFRQQMLQSSALRVANLYSDKSAQQDHSWQLLQPVAADIIKAQLPYFAYH
jgi:hypothetical protein